MRVLFRSDADVLPALQNLWGCWTLLASARAARAPLDLDLPERQVLLDEKGGIAEIRVRERRDAHRLYEAYRNAANVAVDKDRKRGEKGQRGNGRVGRGGGRVSKQKNKT